MKRMLRFLMAALLLTGFGLACTGDRNKGINSDKDRPKPPDPERKEPR
jgi:hypothetical protein